MVTDIKIDDEFIRYLEELSNFQLSPDEKPGVIKDIQEIIDSLAVLNKLETDGAVECGHPFNYTNALREDIPGKPFGRDLILQNAPEKNDEMFRVPKTVN